MSLCRLDLLSAILDEGPYLMQFIFRDEGMGREGKNLILYTKGLHALHRGMADKIYGDGMTEELVGS